MMLAPYHRVYANLKPVLRPAAAFEIWFTFIVAVSFAPASGWLMNRLIVVNTIQGQDVPVSRVLRDHTGDLGALLRLGILQAAVYLAAAVPFGLGIGLTYRLLLREWDFYYYLTTQPVNCWIALSIADALLAGYLLAAAWLYIRWLFAIPTLVFENAGAVDALKTSWHKTRGHFRTYGVPLAVCWLAVIAASLITTWLISFAAARLLADTLSLRIMVPTVVGTLLLTAVVDLAWLIVGKTGHVLLMADFYRQARDVAPESTPIGSKSAAPLSPVVRKTAWSIAAVALAASAVATGFGFVQGFDTQQDVATTGHRGSKVRAPENTLSAIRQAIAEHADYAEIDVQTTADGVVVLLHDADLMRVAALGRRLRDVPSSDLKEIDVGSWFSPEFRNERIPTLQEAIDLSRGRIKLNIELKYTWPDPLLAGKVGDLVRQNDFASECVVSSLNFNALTEIRKDFPEQKKRPWCCET